MRTVTLSLKTLTTSVSRLFVNYRGMFVIESAHEIMVLMVLARALAVRTHEVWK